MAFFDNNSFSYLTNPVQSGMGNILEGFKDINIWGTRMPPYLGGTPATETKQAIPGLLSNEEQQKLQNQALVQGGLGAVATYLAQPKNQGYGSILPYLGKAYLGGMQASQGTYNTAIENLKTQRELQQFALKQEAMQKIMNDPRVKNDPVLYGLAQAGEYDKVASALGPTTDIKNYEEAKKGGFKGTFLQYQQTVDPFKAAMYEWTTGQPLPGSSGGVKTTTGTPIRGQGGMAMFSVVDPNGVEHKFTTQAQANEFKRRAGITN